MENTRAKGKREEEEEKEEYFCEIEHDKEEMYVQHVYVVHYVESKKEIDTWWEQIFWTGFKVSIQPFDLVSDGRSSENIIFSPFIKLLQLPVELHAKPYMISWDKGYVIY